MCTGGKKIIISQGNYSETQMVGMTEVRAGRWVKTSPICSDRKWIMGVVCLASINDSYSSLFQFKFSVC